jgi:hypothetical protein
MNGPMRLRVGYWTWRERWEGGAMTAKRRMNSRKRPVNPRETWHPLAKLGVNYRSFGLNEGSFRRKPMCRKDLQIYGSLANSSAMAVRTYGAKRRAPGKALSTSYCQSMTSVDAQNFIRKGTVIQSITLIVGPDFSGRAGGSLPRGSGSESGLVRPSVTGFSRLERWPSPNGSSV